MNKFVVLLLVGVFCVSSLHADLIMLRCDNGKKELLESPSDIDLQNFHAKFNPNFDTVFMIHGYMTDYNYALQNYQDATASLKQHLSNVNYVGLHWPSDVLWFGNAIKNADRMGPYVTHLLAEITRQYGNSDRKIHLITHSLGGRVLLNTLKENPSRYIKWGDCFPMAPAVHCVSFQQKYANTNLVPQQTWVYYSNGDWVLKYFYAAYYLLFPDEGLRSDEYEAWKKLTAQQQIAYLQELEKKMPQQRNSSEFEKFAYEQIKRAEKDAMGLVGAVLDGQMKVIKVDNIDVTKHVDGHTYWENAHVMQLISEKINK